jgi:hypothetical protein
MPSICHKVHFVFVFRKLRFIAYVISVVSTCDGLPTGRVAADAQSSQAVKRVTGFGEWKLCPMMQNASQCNVSVSATSGFQVSLPDNILHLQQQQRSFFPKISVFNPQSWDIEEPVAVPVSIAALVVRDSSNATVPSTVLPVDLARSHQIIKNRESFSVSDFTLHFNAVVPAFGFSFFTVTPSDLLEKPAAALHSANDAVNKKVLVVGNGYLSLSFSPETNLLASITDVKRNVTLPCTQQLLYYEAEGHLLIDTKHKKCAHYLVVSDLSHPCV